MQASVQLERVGKPQPADRVATNSSAGIQDCRNLRLFVTDKNTGLRFLVDSGADISIILPKDKNRMPSSDYKLYSANGTEIVTYGTKVRNLYIGLRRQFQWPFVIANTNRAILGADFLNNFGLNIDIKNKRVIDGIANLSIRGVIQSISDMGNISTLNSSSKVSAILTKYPNLCRPPSDFVEAKHSVKHYIPTRGQPINSKARRLDSQRLTLAKAEFQYMLNNGIIRPSNSPWASPLHLDESLRPCGYYRRLNAVTLPDRYPIPRLDDFHHILKSTSVYSKIDLYKTFYQIPIAEEDKPKTAIITPFGLFEFNVMSFGLRNATATFQRFMHEVLRNLDFAFVYLDDILKQESSKMETNEIRAVIKYLCRKGISPKEIYEDMVDTLREDAPSYSTVKKNGTEDEHRPGKPIESVTQENIDKIHDLVMLDRRMTVRQIEETLGIPKTTVDRIMREHLGLRKLSARWVPKLLTPDQKAVWRKLSSDNLALFEANPEEFVNIFVTMDKTWAHHFAPESKQQSMQWTHSDSEGVLLLDFLNKGQIITGNYYSNLVKQLREPIKEKRRGKLSRKIVYHQDNAPSHRSLQAMAAIYDSGFELLPHAPYSPDLALSDFHLFPHLKKKTLSGIHFRSDEEVIDAVTSFFESLETSFFLEGIKALEHRWKKCIDLKGDYEIDFLGYLITSHGVKPLPTKVKAILEYKKPKTVRELRIFLGMLNFYRTFLNNAAETQAILHEYLRGTKKKDRSEIEWTEEAEVQFEQCKQALANTALLAYPDTELPISLCTDASDRAKASPRQLRHLQYISQFITDIKYIKGTDNIVADALSRVDAITTIDYEEIAKEQTGDSELQNLISKNTSLKFKQCPLQSGKLLWCDVSTNNIRPIHTN
ncbi:hypothetical protein LAZ67_13000470 [Cordylochernes scorpioides]|uniref:Peptidase A2 domain-containing protein n=1 Tax=Cordylochernes scorpioides TaxID=51811 RepID=A0ABY6L3T4_9ARAC|nr:hypothetical protein LAZ67_13000470 [Cordylochernes scorpioides]